MPSYVPKRNQSMNLDIGGRFLDYNGSCTMNIQRMKTSSEKFKYKRHIPKYAIGVLTWAKPETRTTTIKVNGTVRRVIPNNQEVLLRGR